MAVLAVVVLAARSTSASMSPARSSVQALVALAAAGSNPFHGLRFEPLLRRSPPSSAGESRGSGAIALRPSLVEGEKGDAWGKDTDR